VIETIMTTTSKRRVVTLCGSTKFYDAFQLANLKETMEGRIVLSVGSFMRSEQPPMGCTPEQKDALDELHFDKISMSDEILVLNVDGYVGESTRNEIALAIMLNKPIRWYDELLGGDRWIEDNSHDIWPRIARHVANGRGRPFSRGGTLPIKRVKAKIAVAIDENGEWAAVGGNDLTDRDAQGCALDGIAGDTALVHWVTAEIPVPRVLELNGAVESSTDVEG